MAGDAFIEFRNIVKTFGGVIALNDVSLTVGRGECHALMGENGAGKSTLGKSLAGIHRADSGEIRVEGKAVRIHGPADAAALGIGMVHQELAFCPDLSVAENLSLGHYPGWGGFFSRGKAIARAEQLLGQIGMKLDVTQNMRTLSTAEEQMVQIAAAIGTGARVLVFDEPTSSLSEREAQQLFALIENLKQRGVTMIYVSHRMPEVFRLCDAISVLRDGKYVGTLRKEAGQGTWPAGTQDQVVQMMIGRPVADYLPQYTAKPDDRVVLEVRSLSSPGKFQDVKFSVRAGEIVGFAGLVGAGRSQIGEALFGLDKQARGDVVLEDKPLRLGSIKESMRRGIGLVPEDRKRQGLVLMMGGRQNFSLPLLDRMSVLGFLKHGEERRGAADYFGRLRVKTSSLAAPVSSMSGGNQQKVVIAKWLARGARLLIVDEPTRGVDVGAKAAIHHLLDELASQGVAIMLISSELPEVLGISSRVLVMREGRLVGEVSRAEATQEKVLRMMAGV